MTRPTDFEDAVTMSQAVVDALRTYPVEPAPPTLAPGVYTRLRSLPAGIRPRFRLSWFDWVMGLFTTGMAGVGFVVWQTLPPQAVAQLQVIWMIWLQHLSQLVPHLPA